MNPVVIIPVYVSSHRRSQTNTDVINAFNPMVSLGQQGTLPRLLESLQEVKNLGPVLVLAVSEHTIGYSSTDKLRKALAAFPSLNAFVAGNAELDLIHQRMDQLGLEAYKREVGMKSYGAVRNFALALAQAMGFDALVFVNDDEIVESPDFLARAMYGMGKLTPSGAPILVKSGFYLDEKGSYLSRRSKSWQNKHWPAGDGFNAWITHAMSGARLSRANHVCGGCMAIHKEAFKKIPFDAWVGRGEDLDYLLNVRMHGADVWFDNQWSLRYVPASDKNEGFRFRQDVYRWVYELRKLEYGRTQIDLFQVKAASLEPYPGRLLDEGIERRLKKTARRYALARPDKLQYFKAGQEAKGEAGAYAESHCTKYFEFRPLWEQFMARIEGDTVLLSALLHLMGADAGAATEADVPSSDSAAAQTENIQAPSPSYKLQGPGLDPGTTGDIRLNLSESESD